MRIFGVSLFSILLLAFAYWLGTRNTLNSVVSAVTGAAA